MKEDGCLAEDCTMQRLFAAFAVLFVLLSGCSGGLSRKAAGRAIENSGGAIMMGVTYGRLGTKCADEEKHVKNQDPATDIVHVASSAAELIRVTPDGPNFWKVELTGGKPSRPPVRTSYRFVANGCDYEGILITLANQSVMDVGSINQITDSTAEAEYTWKWALTPAGAKIVDRLSLSQLAELDQAIGNNFLHDREESYFALADMGRSTSPHQSRATLKKSNDGWQVAE